MSIGFNVEEFERQVECLYKGERYAVRDNGAIFRHPKPGKTVRKLDNTWTTGNPNNNGYLLIGSEVVHRIVAYAFLGEPPTPSHIVDHLDTNRQNNRPENLRWLTKLENALNNPITLKRIIFRCGSIEAFIQDPSILKKYESDDRNFSWMRSVAPEEARISWERLQSWAKRKTINSGFKGGSLGEWIYNDNENPAFNQEKSELTSSLTPNAIQKNLKTPTEFPFCPKEITDNSIVSYAENLVPAGIFSTNKFSSLILSDHALSKDEGTLWVLGRTSDPNAPKPWFLVQITCENELYVHSILGSFFAKAGAEKQFTLIQGLEWKGGETFDDFA
jgi:hypothetical protein